MAAAALPLAICLLGPTASGKTALAMQLVEQLPCDIISVDSALIYRGMDIGTAKPTADELARAPHRLIDILDPAERYSAADFRRDALAEMQAVVGAGRIPLLVGGTMLYFKALLEGLADMPEGDLAIRAQIEEQAAREGWPALHAELALVDPAAAARIHPHHSQRIERALNVYRSSGVPLSAYHQQQSERGQQGGLLPPYRFVQLAIAPAERGELHRRIARRFEQMQAQGLIEEVAKLRARGDLHTGLPSMRAVGYRQVWDYLEGQYDRAAMIERGVIATRQLAKRQLTWLRGWPGLHWLLTDDEGLVAEGTHGEKQTPIEAALKYIDESSAADD